ncbi:MAG: DUF3307 domain-containing protein [Desulfobacterales bacterium]
MHTQTLYLFVFLLAGHIAGDFLLQTKTVATRKNRWTPLLQHSAIVAGLSYLLCGAWMHWEIPLAIFLTHALIDRAKVMSGGKTTQAFVIDQLAHVSVTLLTAVLVVRYAGELSLYWVHLFGPPFVKTVVFVAGAVATVRAGGFLIGLAVQPLLAQFTDAQPPSNMGSSEGLAAAPGGGLIGGGQLIGQLERALVFLLIMMGQPAAVGFLITAKSIFRFGDIREHRQMMLAEYIIIGTLMSFAYGIFLSYLTKILIEMI